MTGTKRAHDRIGSGGPEPLQVQDVQSRIAAPIKLDRRRESGGWQGGFGIQILYPGVALGTNDSGIAAIGRIDHARIPAGHIIRMHPHRDDEILTYVRHSGMLHRDTVGDQEEITRTRLMLMNAGHTFEHEEKMLGPEPLEPSR
jgi:redox-sensitive bicupin YhaK (pirin superfamily)